jgi:two-component system, cell cycle sensor histidine kinase and response regulator CckA
MTTEPPALPEFGGMPTLLVEDNARLRMLMVSSLEALGCSVTAAGEASEALGLIEQGLRPTLLISDVRMPGRMDGVALAEIAAQRLPGLRVLLLTGYSATAVTSFDLLHKPFTLEELAAAIGQVVA